ncbi:Yersinia protein of uncharacterised function (DUF3831) [Yersinia pseudotuberculosis]|nr:Yersinia protein of uncharacterised function (DUF3831) [Yersinia pseudotuberculosis]
MDVYLRRLYDLPVLSVAGTLSITSYLSFYRELQVLLDEKILYINITD